MLTALTLKKNKTEQSKNMTLHKKNKCQQIEERYSWKNQNINTQNLSFPWVGGCVWSNGTG